MNVSTSRPVAWCLETWPTAVLANTIRHDLDDGKVQALAAHIKAGFDLPPIFVLMADNAVKILDGHHRVKAWMVAGMTGIPVLVGRVR